METQKLKISRFISNDCNDFTYVVIPLLAQFFQKCDIVTHKVLLFTEKNNVIPFYVENVKSHSYSSASLSFACGNVR